MKVALWQPRTPDLNRVPALGLLGLAGVLAAAGHEPRVFHDGIDEEPWERLLSFAPEVVGVSAVTVGLSRAIAVAGAVRRRWPGALTVIGGAHATARPFDGLGPCAFHVAVVGEAEQTLPRLLATWAGDHRRLSPAHLAGVPGLALLVDDAPWFSGMPPLLTPAELESLPPPRFSAMDLDGYFRAGARHGLVVRGRRVLPLMTSRGCPQTCTFCCRILGARWRPLSAERVLDDMARLVSEFGVDEVFLEDDNFFVDRRRAVAILEGLLRWPRRPWLKFANGVRIDRLDAGMLDLMRAVGIDSVSFGIESGSPATLARMAKRLDLGEVRRVVGLARRAGFWVGGNCILGYPGETLADLRESVEFLRSLELNSSAIVNLIPFPGTRVREECERHGWLTAAAADFDNYYFRFWDPVPLVATPHLSGPVLVREMRRAYRRLYLRPKVLAGVLGTLLGVRH